MRKFNYRGKTLDTSKTIIAGIVNVTPDSFSDGGRWYGVDEAVAHGLELVDQGAGMLDIGGESTRPGSDPVAAEEELGRIKEVIIRLKEKTNVPLSIDTWKASVARGALEAGADIINDITGLLGDPDMAGVIAGYDAGLILMNNPVIARPNHPASVIFPVFGKNPFSQEELKAMEEMGAEDLMMAYFDKALKIAQEAGIKKENIMLDPGIGFGLSLKENLILLNRLDLLHKDGFTAFVGVSRKRFISNTLESAGFPMKGQEEENHFYKDQASGVLTSICARAGIEVVRVHNVEASVIPALISDTVRGAYEIEDQALGAYEKKEK